MKEQLYKYETYLAKVRNQYDISCPSEEAQSQHITAFRWIYEDINHEFNFIPPAIIAEKQGRKPRKFPPDDSRNCDVLALSMYNSAQNASHNFKKLGKRVQQLLGYTHIAVGEIRKEDGVITPTTTYGHFDLHEFETTDLTPKFKILKSILS